MADDEIDLEDRADFLALLAPGAFARSQAAGKYPGASLRFAQTQRFMKRQYLWRRLLLTPEGSQPAKI